MTRLNEPTKADSPKVNFAGDFSMQDTRKKDQRAERLQAAPRTGVVTGPTHNPVLNDNNATSLRTVGITIPVQLPQDLAVPYTIRVLSIHVASSEGSGPGDGPGPEVPPHLAPPEPGAPTKVPYTVTVTIEVE